LRLLLNGKKKNASKKSSRNRRAPPCRSHEKKEGKKGSLSHDRVLFKREKRGLKKKKGGRNRRKGSVRDLSRGGKKKEEYTFTISQRKKKM